MWNFKVLDLSWLEPGERIKENEFRKIRNFKVLDFSQILGS